MAPGAHLLNLKVLKGDGTGKVSDVLEAIDWAVDNREEYGIRVLNLSLGMAPTQSYRDDPLCQAVERAARAGLVVVASAGNYGQTADGKTVLGSVTSRGRRRSPSPSVPFGPKAPSTRAMTRWRRGVRGGRR